MAEAHVVGSFYEREVILGLQMQASGERKVSADTLRSGMLEAAAQNKLTVKGDL